jgi:hypothetical protein
LIDVDQVEQRPKDIVDAGEVLGAGPCAGALERKVEGLGTRSPPRRVIRRSLTGRCRGLVGSFCCSSSGFRCPQVCDQSGFDDLSMLALDAKPLGVGVEEHGTLGQHVEPASEA